MAHNFIHKAAQAINRFSAPAPKPRLRDFLREIPDAARNVFIETPIRATLNLAGRTQEVKRTFPGGEVPRGLQPLLGREPIKPFQEMPRTIKTQEFLQRRGFSERSAKIGGLAAGFALTAAEADPRVGFGKASKFRIIAKPDKALMIKFIDYVRLGAARTAPNVDLELDAVRTAERYGIKLPRGKDVLSRLANEFDNTLATIRQGAPRRVAGKPQFTQDKMGRFTVSKGTTKNLDPLAQEARKYKSVEDFIAAYKGSGTQYGKYNPSLRQGGTPGSKRLTDLGVDPEKSVTIYRGIDDTTGKLPRKIGDGDFVTTDFDSAKAYTGSEKDVISMKVKAKDLFVDDPDDFLTEPFYKGSEYIYSTKQAKAADLTKSQLTDIYNKSKGMNSQSGFINFGEFLPGQKESTAAEAHLASRVADLSEPFYKRATNTGREFLSSLKSNLVDSFSPIADAVRKSGVKLSAIKDPRLLRLRVLGAGGVADQMLQDGLEPVLQGVGPKDLDRFNRYLVARHSLDVSARGIKTGVDPDMARQYMLENSNLEESAQYVTQYTQHMLSYAARGGLISQDLYKTLLDRYPNYVPLHRVFEDLEEVGGTKAVASLGKQNIVKKLMGSEREIVSPIDSIIEKTYQVVKEVEVNRTAQSVVNLRYLDEFKDIIKPIEKAGKKPTISVFHNGKKELYEVPKEFEEAAKNLGLQSMNILGRILNVPVRVARLGITGINPGFILSNFARDQQTAFLTTEKAFSTSLLNPYNFVASLFDSFRKGGEYSDFIRAGGGGSHFIAAAKGQARTTAKELARTKGGRIATTITNPAKWMSALEDLVSRGEMQVRVQQFRGTRRALGEAGDINILADPTEASLQALKAGRENTVDFAQKGAWGNVLNSAFIYLNAGIQGSRLTMRTFRTRPAATTFKVATSLFTPIAVTTMWNLATPERRQAYMDIPEWERTNNLIILPPNPEVDEEGRYVGAVKIPLPQGFNSLAVPVRTSLEHLSGLDPGSIPEILLETLSGVTTVNFGDQGAMTSRITPTAILPILENSTNTQLFTGLPLTPRSVQDLPPAEQTKEGISGAVELIGRELNYSPIKLQNLVRGYTGGVGLNVLNAIDRGLVLAGIIPPEEIGGRGLIEDIKFRFARARTGELERQEIEEVAELKQQGAMRELQEDKAAQEIYKELQKLSETEWKHRLSELKQQGILDKPIYDEVVSLHKATQQNLSRSEKFARSLPVVERAEYIMKKLGEMPREEQRAYLSALKQKGIFTENVYKQLTELGYELP